MKQSEDNSICNRKLFMDAAEALFAANGFSRTTVEDITDRIGFSKGSIYNYFPSKESIFLTIINKKLQTFLSGIKAVLEINENLEESLERLIENHLDFFHQNANFFRLIAAERYMLGAKVSDDLRTKILSGNQEYQRLMQTILERYSGFLREDITIEELTVVLRGVISSFLTECMLPQFCGKISGKPSEILSLFLDGARKKTGYLSKEGRSIT